MWVPLFIFSFDGCLFIKDGYLWSTSLYSVNNPDSINNPFLESKIINIYPDGSESFASTLGVPDTAINFHEITIIDLLVTTIKTFHNVQKCNVILNDTTTQIYLFYTANYGHVSTHIIKPYGKAEGDAFYFSLKKSDIEIGEPVPYFNETNKVCTLQNSEENKNYFVTFCYGLMENLH